VLSTAAESGYFFRSGYRLRAYFGEVHLRHVAHEMRAHGVTLLELRDPSSAALPPGHDPDPHSCLLVHRREDVTPSFINAYARFFHAPAPILGLSRAQQRVLERALLDQSDAEIAGDLAISVDGVKKTWRQAFDRVAQAAPHLIPPGGNASQTRGGEKRRHLLHFLRTHLEELRPYELSSPKRGLSGRRRPC
jgi:DNA-binding CsgD family transcriptional regulator